MSVVGEIASVAGLIGLTGQTLSGCAKVYSAIISYKSVSQQAGHVANDCEALKSTLSRIQDILSQFSSQSDRIDQSIDALFSAISKCQTTLREIEGKIDTLSADKKPTRLQRAKVVSLDSFFTSIQSNLVSERENLNLYLSALTVSVAPKIIVSVWKLTVNSQVGLGINQGIEKIAGNTSTAKAEIAHIHTTFGTMALAAEHWATAFDAELQALRQEVQLSLRSRRSKHKNIPPAKYSRRISHKATRTELVPRNRTKASRRPEEHFLRVVTPAILSYMSRGDLCQRLVGLEEYDLACLNVDRRKAFIQQLLQLRLLAWLFTKDYSMPQSGVIGQSSSICSNLFLEAGLFTSRMKSMLAREASEKLESWQKWQNYLDSGQGGLDVVRILSIRVYQFLYTRWRSCTEYQYPRLADDSSILVLGRYLNEVEKILRSCRFKFK